MAKKSGYSQAVCEEVLTAYHELLVEAVENGDRVTDFGYLDIESAFVPEHFRYDPRDNTTKVKVKDKYKLKITAGKKLKDAVKRTMANIGKPEL